MPKFNFLMAMFTSCISGNSAYISIFDLIFLGFNLVGNLPISFMS